MRRSEIGASVVLRHQVHPSAVPESRMLRTGPSATGDWTVRGRDIWRPS